MGWLQACRAAIARKLDNQRSSDRLRYGVADADAARGRHDLATAITGYEAYLRRRPKDIGIRMRKARAHLAAGQFHLAEQTLLEVLRRRPGKPEVQAELASVRLAESRRPESLKMLPVSDREQEAWRFGAPAYDAFRQSLVIPPLPEGGRHVGATTIVIDARDSDLSSLQACLSALAELRGAWRALVITPDGQQATVAAGAELLDSRIAFTTPDAFAACSLDGAVMLLAAEAVVAPEALDWLAFTLARTGARAVYADHDRAIAVGAKGLRYFAPALQSAAHREDMTTNVRPPLAVLFGASDSPRGAWISEQGAAVEYRRSRLIAAFDEGVVVHVPLLLSTSLEPATVAGMATVSTRGADWAALPKEGYPLPSVNAQRPGRLLVVVPTRDEAASLQVMVDSLLSLADDPGRMTILVVDNGSSDPLTAELLQRWTDQGTAEVLRIDEPFNWSRLNNLAVADRTEDAFLFINNDMEMLTRGWDSRLRATLARPGIGVVGARLFYPSGSVQHAGMALNGLEGAPLHEGLGAGHDDTGPLDRWTRSRPASALTGAFLAVRREPFVAVGGFDEIDLPISCSDIDFCMRIRARGLTVLYDGETELVHFESRTRGHSDTEAKVKRALAELNSLRATWGEALLRDPSRNPHWLGHSTRLFQWVRCPDVSEVMACIDRARDAWGASD